MTRTKIYVRIIKRNALMYEHQGPQSDADINNTKCHWLYTGKIDAQMAVMTNCREEAKSVIAYRYGEAGPWTYLSFCETHGGLLKAESDFILLAKEYPVQWEGHDRLTT